MNKPIKIGTRDSQLALWQANRVKKALEFHGYKATLVPLKSQGDLQLNQPIYSLGITGVFTKVLDTALLNKTIDIAVHSMKDVPTILSKGIVQAAVLKRGPLKDVLVYKNNEEFLSTKHAVIATGSLRRKAQWLNKYPTHNIEDLRGNVNRRLQKLNEKTHWNAAIFAAAGLKRINLLPNNYIDLDWMLPAPAQGAIMITALEEDTKTIEICNLLNHEETQICTGIERNFLNKLEGGCTAPIGALALIRKDKITFKGILLNKNGSRKIEVQKEALLNNYNTLAEDAANYILELGGKELMRDLHVNTIQPTIFSTKALTPEQKQRFKNRLLVKDHDCLQISYNRIKPADLNKAIHTVVFTSKNAVEALLHNISAEDLKFKNIYCVGRRTKKLIEQRIGHVTYSRKNAEALAQYIVNHTKEREVVFICGNLRLNTLPNMLTKNNILVEEIEAYQTKFNAIKIPETIKQVLFFSPSTVTSFVEKNPEHKNIQALCIGETTAKAARTYYKNVKIAKLPTIEHVIDLIKD